MKIYQSLKKRMADLKNRLIQRRAVQAAVGAGLLLGTEMAMAAKTGTEFKKFADMVKGWSEGYLGMALALTAFLIGMAVGLMKQTVMPAIVGLGVALFATMGPGIIMSMFTAVI